MRILVILAIPFFFYATCSIAGAADKLEFPNSQPPQFIQIVSIDKVQGRLEYQYAVDRPVSEEQRVLVERGGKQVEEVVVRTRMVREFRQAVLLLKDTQIIDGEGKKLNGEDGWKKLSTGSMVLRALDARGVDAMYRKLLAKDTLILVPLAVPSDPMKK